MIKKNIILETNRLNIIHPTSLQAEEILSYYLRNKLRFTKTTNIDKHFYHLPSLKEHLDKMIQLKDLDLGYLLHLYRKDNAQFIGTVYGRNIIRSICSHIQLGGLSLDIGCEGKGYMFETLQAVVNFNFYTLKLKRIESACHPLNVKSKKMLLKLGFKKIGYDSTYVFMDDKEYGSDLLSLNIKDWEQSAAA